MRVWKKASGAFKDRCSILVAKLSPHGPCRNPNLETVIIKATSHDEQCMDYKNIQKVFQWLRTSPLYLKPLLYTVSMRLEKTHSWVVALKGLMLVHGVFCFDLPAVHRMGKLSFNLSHFSDAHLSSDKAWGYNVFVRAYYSYLDQKSSYVCLEAKKATNKEGKKKKKEEVEEMLVEEIQSLERLQGLIDAIMQVKPKNQQMNVVLVLEAMDCVVDEILEVYEKFCKGVERVLLRIYDIGGKVEAGVALGIMRKVETQADKLSVYLNYCKDIGVLNSSDYPKIMRVPEKDINELRRIMNGASERKTWDQCLVEYENKDILLVGNKDIVIGGANNIIDSSDQQQQMESENGLKTVVTNLWEAFDDTATNNNNNNPFMESSYALVPYYPTQNHHVLPDLISL